MKTYKVTVDEDGSICWFNKEGQRHREDGPAIEWSCGGKAWYVKSERHREDGPAIEYANGDKKWFINGELHRIDGPAIEYANGVKRWFLTGTEYTEERFNAELKPVEITLEEIANKFGIAVKQLRIKKNDTTHN